MEGQPVQIGPYRIDGELGRGGMGVVYLGHDQRLERPVAIKALPHEFAQEPERLARFEREAKVLASLNHPNLGAIYGLEEVEDSKYLILEYVEGSSLADRLAQGPVAMDEALEICRQIALGIEAAHEAGVVHRDLKPGNVRLTSEGLVKVLDFGLAKPTGADAPSGPDLTQSPTLTYGATREGIVLGTAGYMSPEQARGRRVDRRTDMWSLGCILYEMLTGAQAFQGETISDTLAAVLRGEPDWSLLPEGTPEALRRLLHRCLEKDPKKRMRDAADAVLDIDEALHGPLLRTGTSATVSPRPVGYRRSLAWASGAVLCLLLGLAAGRFLPGGTSKGNAAQGPLMVSVEIPKALQFRSGAIAPDGGSVVFVAADRSEKMGGGSGNPKSPTRAYLRRLDSFALEPINGTEGARNVFFSPDGHWLGFLVPVSPESNKLRIMKVPVDGSTPPVAVVDWKDGWLDVGWLPDGDLFICTSEVGKFVRTSAAGNGALKEVKALDDLPGTVRYVDPRGIPDTPLILLSRVAYAARGFQMDAVLFDVVTGKLVTLLEEAAMADYVRPGYLLFSRGETLLAVRFDLARRAVVGGPVAVMGELRTENSWSSGGFQYASNGSLGFAPGGRLGDKRRVVLGDPSGTVPWAQDLRAYNGQVAASPDGKRIAVGITRTEGLDEIWISDAGSTVLRRFAFLADADVDYPVWSRDGKKLAYFRSSRSDKDGVYWMSVDRPDEHHAVVNADASKILWTPSDWTPDGKAIICFQRDLAEGKARLMKVEVPENGGAPPPPELFLESGSVSATGSFSPDGRMFAFASNVSGQSQVFVCKYGDGGRLGPPVPVSAGSGYEGLWSSDGKSLAYLADDGKLYSVDLVTKDGIAPSAPVRVMDTDAVGLVNGAEAIDRMPDGRFILIQRGDGEGEVGSLRLVLHFNKVIQAKVNAGRS
jgi:serine/threonine-protein kinase